MIFKIVPHEDKEIEAMLQQSMKELTEFWGLHFTENPPQAVIFEDRKTIDQYKQRQTQNWLVGWGGDNNIYLLGPENYERDSDHKYSKDGYRKLIKHELCHIYFKIMSGGRKTPAWLNEGVCLYLAGQTHDRQKPQKLREFLDYFEYNGSGKIYSEAGFVVETLVKHFGAEKFVKLVRSLVGVAKPDDFYKNFQDIYEFELTYEKMNKLYLS